MNPSDLENKVVQKLTQVIDPETGVDVMRMKLVQNVAIDPGGNIAYTFRPSSPLCPIAVPLALQIIQAISEVPGISAQSINVVDYIQADQLNEILKKMFAGNL